LVVDKAFDDILLATAKLPDNVWFWLINILQYKIKIEIYICFYFYFSIVTILITNC
jgi:hypothetical protein